VYYTVADGDGQTTTASEADVDLGGNTRPAAQRRTPVLRKILCQRFYADEIGRPGLPPGRYFRLLLVGYFEGLDAERAIAWRAADSFALREFLGLVLPEVPPDHSTISRTRRLIDLETHHAVFTWILQRLADAGLVKGNTIGIDATTLEANAALRSIVRRDTGATYQEFLTQLAQASGIETPTREDLARLDRKRPKKGSNDDWTHPLDPDAKINTVTLRAQVTASSEPRTPTFEAPRLTASGTKTQTRALRFLSA
jgi:transposase